MALKPLTLFSFTRRMPLGRSAPASSYLRGSLKKSTTVRRSSFKGWRPPMSSKVFFAACGVSSCRPLSPRRPVLPEILRMIRIMKTARPPSMTMSSIMEAVLTMLFFFGAVLILSCSKLKTSAFGYTRTPAFRSFSLKPSESGFCVRYRTFFPDTV